MNEPDTFDPALLKSLFARLVREAGRHDAVAVRLGVCRQRVGQLCSANPEHARDIPTWEQVWTVEQSLGRSVVFAELARMVEPPKVQADACPVKETHDLVRAVTDMLPLVDQLDPAKPETVEAFRQGLARVECEAVEVGAVANNITKLNERRA